MAEESKSILSQFIAKAAQRLEEKKKQVPFTLHFQSIDTDIVFRPCTRAELIESQEMTTDTEPHKGDRHLVYTCAKNPDLAAAAQQLMAEGKIKEYMDIMDTFTDKEVAQASVEIATAAGLFGGGVKKVEQQAALREAAKDAVKN